MNWLLDPDTHNLITQATNGGFTPSADQQLSFDARFSSEGASASRILSVAGSSAEISIVGALTQEPNFFAFLFGGGNTTYPEIVSALIDAESNDDVESIVLAIDSPGGQFEGMFDVIEQIQKSAKAIEAVVSNVGASAAYAIASQAGKITATNKAARLGSIGVAATMRVDENEISISSTASPKKRPDITTEEGKAVIREQLDAMHQIFVEAIATGRATTVEKVNAEFGQGATLLADEALKVGMIDGIKGESASQPVVKTGNPVVDKPEAKSTMDIQTLKAQHPDVFTAAMNEGVTKERDRVGAHLKMGQASGDMETACAAIADGSEMTATLQATYMAAGMNRSDINATAADAAAAAAADGASDDAVATAADEVATAVEAKLGTEVK